MDPIKQQITVFTLVAGLYEEAVFAPNHEISSNFLSKFGQTSPLTAAQVLQLNGEKED